VFLFSAPLPINSHRVFALCAKSSSVSRKRVEDTSPTAITFRRFCRISPNKVST